LSLVTTGAPTGHPGYETSRPYPIPIVASLPRTGHFGLSFGE